MNHFIDLDGIFQMGQHRGEHVSAVSTRYIRWALANVESLRGRRYLLMHELLRRGENFGSEHREHAPPARPTDRLSAEEALAALELIAAGRRALALKHHPDRGGSTRMMQTINATADRLESRFRMMAGGAP